MQKGKLKYFASYEEFKVFFKKCYQFIKENYFHSNSLSHSLEHTLRVVNLTQYLCDKLGAYLDVALTAAIFHRHVFCTNIREQGT